MRNEGLDLIRAISVLMVVISHWDWDHKIKPFIWYIGNYAVHLFFVLSGFLVGGILLREYQKTGAVRPWTFLLRRGVRIYPLYYLSILVVVLIRISEFDWRKLIYDCFYLPYWGYHGHYWTLKVEEHFYVFAALIFWLASKFPGFYGVVVAIFASIPIVQLVLRATLLNLTETEHTDRIIMHSYGSIAAGVLLAVVHALFPKGFTRIATEYRWWIMVPSFLAYMAHRYVPRSDDVMVGQNNPEPEMLSFGYTMFDRTVNRLTQTLLACAVVYGFYGFATLPKIWKPVLWIGVYSYAIYLFHMDFKHAIDTLNNKYGSNPVYGSLLFVFYMVSAIAVGGLVGIGNQWFGDKMIQRFSL